MARRKQCPRCGKRPRLYGDGHWCRKCTSDHSALIAELVGYVVMGRAVGHRGTAQWEQELLQELAIAPSDMWSIVSAAQEATGLYPTY